MAKGVKAQPDEQNIRFTMFAKETSIKRLDYIARKESFEKNATISRTDLVNQALEEFIAKFEKKNGSIPLK
jgi:hypothetical protein